MSEPNNVCKELEGESEECSRGGPNVLSLETLSVLAGSSSAFCSKSNVFVGIAAKAL